MYEIKFKNGDVKEFKTLIGASLRGAILQWADLRGADLRGANLQWADLRRADLQGADLQGADLRGADLERANLSSANLNHVIGNMKELKTLQLDTWAISIWKDIMQIGCERHTIDNWFSFNEEQIAKMDSKALDWWNKWESVLSTIIDNIRGTND